MFTNRFTCACAPVAVHPEAATCFRQIIGGAIFVSTTRSERRSGSPARVRDQRETQGAEGARMPQITTLRSGSLPQTGVSQHAGDWRALTGAFEGNVCVQTTLALRAECRSPFAEGDQRDHRIASTYSAMPAVSRAGMPVGRQLDSRIGAWTGTGGRTP